jgi:hypothetical protein
MVEPEQLQPGQKIRVPESFRAAQQEAQSREGAIGDLRTWLASEHRKDLQENPNRSFKLKSVRQENLTDEERQELAVFEERVFSREKELAMAVERARREWIAAGATEEQFQEHWALFGESEFFAQRVAENRARNHSSIY